MVRWNGLNRHRGIVIVTTVAAMHLVVAFFLLPMKFSPSVAPDRNVLDIVLADLTPEPEPDPILTPDRTSTLEPPPIVSDPPEPTPAPAQAPVQTPSPEPATPEPTSNATAPNILTQLDQTLMGPPVSDSGKPQMPAGTAPDGTSEITPAQIANVLRQANCLELKRHEDGACPPPDPFEIALANAERAIPLERLFGDPRYISKTVDDKVFESRAAKRFHWPDADLFADPMAPGAYNARRIRNGQEPLWSQEMRDGFRKSD